MHGWDVGEPTVACQHESCLLASRKPAALFLRGLVDAEEVICRGRALSLAALQTTRLPTMTLFLHRLNCLPSCYLRQESERPNLKGWTSSHRLIYN